MTPASTARVQASGSSFYAAMRLLPKAEREAMFAIYGFCRAVDDIADDPGPSRVSRSTALDQWRERLAALYRGQPAPELAALANAVARFDLAETDFLAIVDGMAMDVEADIRAPDFAAFDLYCDRVASAVGRLAVRVFGMAAPEGERLAHHLGRALQYTNVLRDLDEDAAIGRLYLPAEALAAARLTANDRDPRTVIDDPAIDTACRWLADRAGEHYARADELLATRPSGRLAAPRLMSAVYGRMLERMRAAGWAAPRSRARIGKGELFGLIVTRGWLA
ncbi:MAG: presqualene diphosphate synthase HpnD [Caulobacteraceae bacterium]